MNRLHHTAHMISVHVCIYVCVRTCVCVCVRACVCGVCTCRILKAVRWLHAQVIVSASSIIISQPSVDQSARKDTYIYTVSTP